MSRYAFESWAGSFYWNGWQTASISSFPFRHSATWWNHGFMEAMNLMRGMGAERADQVVPGALDWLERRGRADEWFLHVHLWDPHTPYNTPDEFGNPFDGDPFPRGTPRRYGHATGGWRGPTRHRSHGGSPPTSGAGHRRASRGMPVHGRG